MRSAPSASSAARSSRIAQPTTRREARSMYHGEIEKAAPRRHIGDVADPHAIRLRDGKLPVQQILRDRICMRGVGRVHPRAPHGASGQPVPAHDTGDAFLPHAHALVLQVPMDARRAIRLVAVAIGRADAQQQRRVGRRACAGPARAPPIKPGRRHREHPTHESHSMLALMASDTGVLHGDSFAKNTKAFFANARSSRKIAFSRRSRRSS